jgi:CRISPR-associated protein Csm1
VGSYLPKANCVWFFDNPGDGKLPILGYSVSIGGQPPMGKNPYLVMKLNDTDLSNLSRWPAASKYMATYVARSDDRVLNFGEIANAADGRKLLGFLKADVDRLGELFIFGLKRKDGSFDTISRQATLSRLLDMFFTGWLESLLNSEFKNCYTVFSGGDDLFFVGPWNEIISLAGRIQVDFTEFTGNPQLTISAGIAITNPDYPVARAAELVEAELKKSKNREGKASITLLGTTLKWPDWAMVKKEWEYLQPLTEDVPSAFLYNMLAFADMWHKYDNGKGDILGLRYHPLLAYNISRNLDPKRMPGIYKWTTALLKWPPGAREKMILDNLGLMTTLCLYSKRGGER